MKAIVGQGGYGAPGEMLRLEDVPVPEVRDDDVLVRVRAASVNPADWHNLRGDPRIARLSIGLRGPKHKVLGCDVAGEVEGVGRKVTTWQPGDEVFGTPFPGYGGFAEKVRVPAAYLARKPTDVSFAQAAAVPLAALTALQGLRDHGRLAAGQHVLIVGASGGVGTFAVQLAKALEAVVTAVCSAKNHELVRSIGADHVIDYTQDDFTSGDRRYDLILQVAGTTPISSCRRALTPKGTLVLISGDPKDSWVGPIGRMLRALVLNPFVPQKLTTFVAKANGDDLDHLADLLAAGTITPVIDRSYPLAEVPEALTYLETGRARGKVVITL